MEQPDLKVSKYEPVIREKCGTTTGYNLHYTNKESTCQPCKDANNAYHREYTAKNKEKRYEIWKRYRDNNPEPWRRSMRGVARRRRAQQLSVETERYTEAELLEMYGTDCYLCNKPIDLSAPKHANLGLDGWEEGLQIDHVIPLSKEGTDVVSNLRPVHAKCNRIKSNSII